MADSFFMLLRVGGHSDSPKVSLHRAGIHFSPANIGITKFLSIIQFLAELFSLAFRKLAYRNARLNFQLNP